MNRDKNDLLRFIDAQNSTSSGYTIALKEIQGGQKISHWIWYIFPQLRSLGHSQTAIYYGISDREEAARFLADPVLGKRLREITSALLEHTDMSAAFILGNIDAIKVKSCMTLFNIISPHDIFAEVLMKFYNNERDLKTEIMLL